MRIAIIDTLYDDFIRSLPFDPTSTYAAELQKVHDANFGTSNYYSRHLKPLGWETLDICANHAALQKLWATENGVDPTSALQYIALEQMMAFKPDVVFMQDLSFFPSSDLRTIQALPLFKGGITPLFAGQCSCPMPRYENVKAFDVLFTSFPHYVKKFEEAGVKAVYNPLAFEPSVMPKLFKRYPVDDCVFVGGTGSPSHWKYGMEVLNAVADNIPTFKWWGYGADLLPDGALKRKYQGQAFGLDMYEKFGNAKIVINRHGEVAESYANNQRLFEATGMGALLITDWKQNIGDFFSPSEAVCYTNPAQAVEKIRYYLEHEDERAEIAKAGQQRTLRDHTYAQRMKTVSETLKDMLVAA